MSAASSPLLYGPTGNPIYPTPKESAGRYKRRPAINREIKRDISQYDHAELVSISTRICCRVPSLRAAIRDKNSWAFSNWLPVFAGENESWGEAAEEYLVHEVLPNAVVNELRNDFVWGLRVSGIGLDVHGDGVSIFTEDEQHEPRIAFVPSPRIGNGKLGANQYGATTVYGDFPTRLDGQSVVMDGEYKGLPIYNGIIRRNGKPVAIRALGFDDAGNASFSDIPLGLATHYACEYEFFGQGRGLPRPADAILQWMSKEEIDDQFLKGLKNAAERTVIHKLRAGEDAMMARGNALEMTTQSVPVLNADGTIGSEDREVYVERSQDGTVTYIGADEELAGLVYENPHPNAEAFAMRVEMEALASLGWSRALMDTSQTSRAPTRLETNKANNSIAERQSTLENISIRFFQYAIAKGMQNGRIPRNDAGTDAYKWGVGFPAQMSVDQGNDVTAALNRLKMGLTNERIEAAKEGYVARKIRRDREKEVKQLMEAASRATQFAQTLGHKTWTFEQSMNLFPNVQSERASTAAASGNTG
jgi:hypothetical protein